MPAKKKRTRPTNPWVAHVKKYQADHGCTYKEAMSRAKPSYVKGRQAGGFGLIDLFMPVPPLPQPKPGKHAFPDIRKQFMKTGLTLAGLTFPEIAPIGSAISSVV